MDNSGDINNNKYNKRCINSLKELQSIYNIVKDLLYEDTSIHFLNNYIITNKIDLCLDELIIILNLESNFLNLQKMMKIREL